MTNFALLQTNIAFCDPEANFKRVRELFAQAMAKDPRPDVVVLPEDWSAGFSDEMFHHMEDFVEPENGPSVTVLRELARQYQVWVVGGSIATLHADGKMRNTTFLIDLARTYALKKADVLVVTSDFPNPRVNHWRTLLTARAIENQMFVVACNRVGPSPMGTYCGHSIIIDPWGDIIAEGGGEEEIITGSIDYTKTREVRDLIHMFRDRQPTLYGDTLLRPVD